MGKEFIRYYIGNMSLYTFEKVQKESRKFDNWTLISGTDFKYRDSYGYQQVVGTHEEWIELIRKYSVVAENRQPEKVEPSFLWHNAPLLADVLTLLSLARAELYPVLIIERNLGGEYNLTRGMWYRETSGNRDIMPISNLGQFISEALTFIEQNPSWLKNSGFDPSIHWHRLALQAYRTSPSILEMALYWISLEILASTYVEKKALDIEHKKERVKRFIADKDYSGSEWNFLDGIIDDWYKVRNNAFHEGKDPGLPVDVLKARRQQARDFTSLVLVELLQPQEDRRRLEIAERMQSY